MVESKAKNIKKMLSWSESSSEDEGDELKAIEKEVITHRRKLRVVDEPQLLRRKVDTNTINPKFLRVKTPTYYIKNVNCQLRINGIGFVGC